MKRQKFSTFTKKSLKIITPNDDECGRVRHHYNFTGKCKRAGLSICNLQ